MNVWTRYVNDGAEVGIKKGLNYQNNIIKLNDKL